jgi:hypothetical protein
MRNHPISHHPARPVAGTSRGRKTRRAGAFIVATALLGGTAGAALADPGTPGSTFPEQPGTNLASGCQAILTNPNNAFVNRAEPASTITTELATDACTPGA